MRKQFTYLIAALLFLNLSSCKNFLEIQPEGEIPTEEALQTPNDLQQLLVSCYDVLRSGNFMGGKTQILSELMADNLDGRILSGNWLSYHQHNTTIFNQDTRDFWAEPYRMIYRANTLLENTDLIEGLSTSEKARIEAEAKFLRAVGHFELVRFFGQPFGYTPNNDHLGIPLRLEASQKVQPRETVGNVYVSVIDDLHDAEFVLPTDNGGYATSWAAKAYLAKVHFQMNDFQNAFDYANEIITSMQFSLNPDVMARFSTSANNENIFNLISTGTLNHSGGALQGGYRSDGANEPALRLTSNVYGLATADTSDMRGQNWYTVANAGQSNELTFSTRFNGIDYFNVPLAHLAEMHLIRGEAAAQLDDLATAEADLNGIRSRAGLDPILGLGKNALIAAIRAERRLEMVCEGDRLHELKRQAVLDSPTITINGDAWDCNGMVVQFPDEEFSGNPSLVLNPEGC